MRAEPKRGFLPAPVAERVGDSVRGFIVPGGMGGGGQALNQLLVVMDGIDEPPLRKKFMTKKFNTFLDALYIVPQSVFGKRSASSRRSRARSRSTSSAPATSRSRSLDPALIRPGRMGRHIYFRTPTWEDRRDVFDLYITKVAHEPSLDTPKARDELARITVRLLAGDDRPGVLAGADLRALRRAPGVLAPGHPGGDDDGRGRRRDRPDLRPSTRAARSPSTRPATRSAGTSTWRTGCRRGCRSGGAAAAAATTRSPRSRTASCTGARRRSAT